MKVKIKYLLFIMIVTISLVSGCKGNNNDLIKQLDKMQTYIDENKIFDDDYHFLLTTNSYDENFKLSIVKDNNDYYVELKEDNKSIKSWILLENDEYVVYCDDSKKTFKHLNVADSYLALKTVIESMNLEYVNFDLKNIYKSVKVNIENLIKSCNEDTNTCEIEKKLFSKVTFMINSKISDDTDANIDFFLHNGKLVDMNYQIKKDDIVHENSWHFDYKNQSIKLENKDEYILVYN